MIDPKRLLEDMFGGSQPSSNTGFSKTGTFAAGAAAGGILGVLLGGKKMRKLGGGLLSHGGAAILGGLAYKAWQDWQQNQQPHVSAPSQDKPALAAPSVRGTAFDMQETKASDGSNFQFAVARAIIAAAKADGHVDEVEQRHIFDEIGKLKLDAEEKGFIFDELSKPLDLDAIAQLPKSQEQAAELWLASRLAINPNDVREKAYLNALAAKMNLPGDLVAHLEAQATSI